LNGSTFRAYSHSALHERAPAAAESIFFDGALSVWRDAERRKAHARPRRDRGRLLFVIAGVQVLGGDRVWVRSRLLEPHARAAAVLGDELDAGG